MKHESSGASQSGVAPLHVMECVVLGQWKRTIAPSHGGIPSRMRSSPTQMPPALPPTGFTQDIPNMRPNNIPMNENGTNVHTVDACQLLCHGVESGFLFISGVPGHSCKCGSFTKVKLTF